MSVTLTSPSAQALPAVLGVGSYLPRRIVDNDEICRHIDSTDEWIRSRSGIVTRRWAEPDETLVEMAADAAAKALAAAGVSAGDLDCVVMATFTHLEQTPAAAARTAHRIGADRAAAFDVSAGCAGFVHALALAADTVRSRTSHVLVIGAERMTDLLDVTDRSTAFIFGDGAGAVVLGPSSVPSIGPVVWGADGAKADLIAQSAPWNAIREDPGLPWPSLRQEGQRVFRWAVYEMVDVARRAVAAAGITPGDLAAFVPHQANARIIDGLVKGLDLPDSVAVARAVTTMGNTSGASIPMAMDALLSEDTALSGGAALLLGYGAGLSYAATVVRLP